jgi:pimeloyl-ACP methyl ester carboxylesterase
MADLVHVLMTEAFGYQRYAVRGSDFGGSVLEHQAARHPDAVVGTHDAGPTPAFEEVPDNLDAEERRYLEAVERWRSTEGGCAQVQRTRPQTLAYGLNDAGRAGGVDRREVPALERLRRRRNAALHHGRAADQHHHLLEGP